jgi:DNA repair protein REV1
MLLCAGKPLAVCHSNSANGSAEVSSANYEARAFGVRAGMFMSDAKRRCPGLLVAPYEFEKYEEISEQVCSGLLCRERVVYR